MRHGQIPGVASTYGVERAPRVVQPAGAEIGLRQPRPEFETGRQQRGALPIDPAGGVVVLELLVGEAEPPEQPGHLAGAQTALAGRLQNRLQRLDHPGRATACG